MNGANVKAVFTQTQILIINISGGENNIKYEKTQMNQRNAYILKIIENIKFDSSKYQ